MNTFFLEISDYLYKRVRLVQVNFKYNDKIFYVVFLNIWPY